MMGVRVEQVLHVACQLEDPPSIRDMGEQSGTFVPERTCTGGAVSTTQFGDVRQRARNDKNVHGCHVEFVAVPAQERCL